MTEQVWAAHDHRPAWPPEALRASRSRRKRVPLWVRALEAWVEGQYPVGRHGYTEARAVVEQVILHYEQETMLKEASR